MGIVNGSLELGYKNTAWFTANPTLVLKEGQIVYLEQTGTYKIGNGVSTLNALSFLGVSSETQTLQNVTDLGSTTTNSITANGFIKSGGTSSQFLKANGSVDSTTYLSTQVVPVGGTTGQILAKVDDTDYNLEWIENYANYTSTLKHNVKASVALTKGQAVYVSGASGTNMLVSKASNVSESTSSKTLGLIAQDLAINGQGFVITEGLLSNLNTNSATIGDPVWLGVDGALIYGLVNKPYAPAHLVFIGIVTRVSATVGEIFVKVQNGFELKEIHDVDLITTTPSNNEILTFESSTSLWKPKTVVSALGFTPYNATNPSGYISGITSGMVTTALGFTPYNSTNPSGYITGITSGMVTTALGFTPYDATNPDGYITSSALSTYVPYTGATGNVDLGTRTLFTPLVQASGTLTLNGNGGNVVLKSYNATIFTYTTQGFSATPLAASSGFSIAFSFTKPNNTNQTASSEIPGWNYLGGTRQWATGNITTQRENAWGATTYSFVGASTITNAYGNVFNAPIAGTNATITNNYAAQFNGKVQINGNLTNNGAIDAQYFLNIVNPNNVATATARIQVTNAAGNASVLSVTSNADAVDPSVLLLGGSNKGIIFSSNSVQVLKVFDSTRNFLIQSGGTLTDAGFKLDVNGTGRFQNTLTLATGTTTIAPLKLTAGTNLTTPVNGSFEFDGTNLYFTVGGVRKTVTLI